LDKKANGQPMDVFCFVAAASNSGKTTLIEKIVPLVKKRGLRVAVIKHASKGYDFDHPELDGYLHSGAKTVIVAGHHSVAMIKKIDKPPLIEEMRKDIGEVDMTIYEGFKADARNKIEVFRFGISGTRPLCLGDPSFIALATDTKFDAAIPQFDLNDVNSIAEFIMEKNLHEHQ
jgi:molybdopterin-guanine dinucleotide biosynthesis protein B